MLRLAHEICDKASAVQFLQNRNILHVERECDNGHIMELKLSDREDRWRCQYFQIRDCRQQKQLKSGRWLQGSHLPYSTVAQTGKRHRDSNLFETIYSVGHRHPQPLVK